MTPAQYRKFVCLEEGAAVQEGTSTCLLGHHLKLLYPVLEAFCWTTLSPVDIDLLLLAGLVAFADRDTRRTTRWTRHFSVEMPVHEPDLWKHERVTRSLSEVLYFTTGDLWEFTFNARKCKDEQARQLALKSLPEDELVILPFSGGLDSFTELKLFPFRHPGKKPILVTTLHNQFLKGLVQSTADAKLYSRLRVPVKFRTRHNPEISFRTRTFLFFVVAAVAAKLSQSSMVIVPENGQGGLGPSLAPCGIEHPLQSSHPGFTARLARFLQAVWEGNSPHFIHPNRWKTKAQVIREADMSAGMTGWQETRSCSRSVKRHKRAPFRHCGICGGCLLRRQALFASLLESKPGESYLWQHLEAPTLKESLGKNFDAFGDQVTRSDELVAAAAVIDHASLSRVLDLPPERSPIKRAVRELSESTGEPAETVLAGLTELLQAHGTEWADFLCSLGPKSWVAELGGVAK